VIDITSIKAELSVMYPELSKVSGWFYFYSKGDFMKKTYFLLFILALFLSSCAAVRTTIPLKPEKFIPSISDSRYTIFKGQQVFLSPVIIKDTDIGEGGWYYYGSSSLIKYASDNSVEEYLQACFEKTLKQVGALVYAAPISKSGFLFFDAPQPDKRTAPSEAKDIQIVINKLKDCTIILTATLFTKNTIAFQKDITVALKDAEGSNRSYLEKRTNEFYNKVVLSVLLDDDFQTAFMK
jgi:hypothetical protein